MPADVTKCNTNQHPRCIMLLHVFAPFDSDTPSCRISMMCPGIFTAVPSHTMTSHQPGESYLMSELLFGKY